MIRIKVVHASHVLLTVVIILLVVVLAVLGIRSLRGGTTSQPVRSATLMVGREEAVAVFAAASSVPREIVFDTPIENEHTDSAADGFDIVILPGPTPTPPPSAPAASAAGKRVLIYHTHTNEAYQNAPSDPYVESEPWRTTDQTHSIVRVGEELASLLTGFGLTVVHDTTDHEPPKLGTAYARSLTTLEKYADEPFDLYIDLHRDAYDEAIIAVRAASVGGADAAQLMALVGNGEGFDEKPDTSANLMFARALTERVNALAPGLMRPVLVKTGRYNQHLRTPSLLIEVGHNRNTLNEALNSMPVLARALAEELAS